MTRVRRRQATSGLRVSGCDARGRSLSGGPAAGLGTWLLQAAPRTARGEVAIALVSDQVMRRLNRMHRAVDRPTDVLSFPADPPSTQRTGRGGRTRSLGDIAIARGVAARQAALAGHSLATEVRVLALHGLLHLLGYDHEADGGEMARVEERLRRRAGLPVGLIVRAGRPGRSRQS